MTASALASTSTTPHPTLCAASAPLVSGDPASFSRAPLLCRGPTSWSFFSLIASSQHQHQFCNWSAQTSLNPTALLLPTHSTYHLQSTFITIAIHGDRFICACPLPCARIRLRPARHRNHQQKARLCPAKDNRTVYASPPPIQPSCSHDRREHFLPHLPQASIRELATPHIHHRQVC